MRYLVSFGFTLLLVLVANLCAPAAVAEQEEEASFVDPGHLVFISPTDRIRPRARPFDPKRPDMRCTRDGEQCISLDGYIPDVCRVMEAVALEAGLDTGFFIRLIWRESLFDAGAISPAGAQGIAQFMPGTARLRGLNDPFNPARAMKASAVYLAELRDLYGNLGLAAAAYNAGERRLEAFLREERSLPLETRRYVAAITGHSGSSWRDDPPEIVELALSKEKPFRETCEALGRNRQLKEFRAAPASVPVKPWAVVLASHRSRDITEYRFDRISKRAASSTGGENPAYVRMRLPGMPGRQYTAQIGRDNRAAANSLCRKLQADGVPCLVLKN